MKKIFTLLAVALFAFSAQAQTVYDFSALKISDFTLGDDFTDGGTWKDKDGKYGEENTEYACITYTKKDNKNWSDLVLTGTPVVFQYKNSSQKEQFYRLFNDFIYANGKGSRVTVKNLKAGDVVILLAAGKNSDGCLFEKAENCTADAGNPTAAVPIEYNVEDFTEFKFTVTADGSMTVVDNGAGFHLASVTIVGGGTTPVDPATPHEATTWDFTKELTAEDAAALEADATNWEKTIEGTDPNQFTRYSIAGTWAAKVSGSFGDDVILKANGVELAYAAGLKFARYANDLKDGNLKIDVAKRFNINSKQLRITIAGLAKNDIVRVRFSSTKAEARGFNIENADKTSISSSSTEPVEETLTVAADGEMTLTTTDVGGVYLYALTINAELPSIDTGISVVNAETTTNGAMYDLSGRRVNENYRGVVIMNGKKVVIK